MEFRHFLEKSNEKGFWIIFQNLLIPIAILVIIGVLYLFGVRGG